MIGYLKRLVSSLAAYQVADVVSKFIAVLLLPVYTRYIHAGGLRRRRAARQRRDLHQHPRALRDHRGVPALLLHRRGPGAPRRARAPGGRLPAGHDARSPRSCSPPSRAPLSKLVLGHRDTTTFLIAVLGLWSFTNLELAYGAAARRRAPARLRDRVADQRRADDRRVGGARRRARARARAACCSATTAPRRVVLLGLWWTMRHRLRLRRAPASAERLGAAALRAADGPRRGLGVRAQHHRPLLHLPQPQPGARGALLDRGQARRRGRVHRARVPVRVAAARLLGRPTTPRRRGCTAS